MSKSYNTLYLSGQKNPLTDSKLGLSESKQTYSTKNNTYIKNTDYTTKLQHQYDKTAEYMPKNKIFFKQNYQFQDPSCILQNPPSTLNPQQKQQQKPQQSPFLEKIENQEVQQRSKSVSMISDNLMPGNFQEYVKIISPKHYESKNAHILKNDSYISESTIEKLQFEVFEGQVEGKYNFLMIPPDLKVAEGRQQQIIYKTEHGIARSAQIPRDFKEIFQKELDQWEKMYAEWILYTPDQKKQVKLSPKPKEEDYQARHCSCCDYQIDRDEIPLTCNKMDLKFLGSGFPLLFNYYYWCFIIILVYTVICGSFDVYSNMQGSFCNDVSKGVSLGCHKSLVNRLSFANKQDLPDMIDLQNKLNVVANMVVMILLMFFRQSQRKIDNQIDAKLCSPADFTVMVRNIPQGLDINYQKELTKLFTHHAVPNYILEPTSVTLIYDLQYLNSLMDRLDEAIQRKQDFLAEKTLAMVKKDVPSKEYKDIQDEIHSLLHRIKDMAQHTLEDPCSFAGYAFISFQHEQDKELNDKNMVLLHNNQWKIEEPKYDDLLFNGHKLLIQQAFEPGDVNWEAFYHTGFERFKGRLKSLGLSISLAIGSTLILFSINIGQNLYMGSASKDSNITPFEEDFIQFFSFVISIVIVLLNQKVENLMPDIVALELQVSKSNKSISHATKLSIITFLNSAVIDFVITVFYNKNYYGRGGFIATQTMVFLQNMYLNPLLSIFDYQYYIDRLEMQKIRLDLKKNQCLLTQEQLNNIIEEPEYCVAEKYADILNTMWVTFLYAPLVPIVLPMSLINLTSTYWTEKYILLRRASIQEMVSSKVSIEMIEMLEYILILFALGINFYNYQHFVGNFIFEYEMFNRYDDTSIVVMIMGLVYSIVPMELIVEKIWKLEIEPDPITWDEAIAQKMFQIDYNSENPITGIIEEAQNALQTLDEKDRKHLKSSKVSSHHQKEPLIEDIIGFETDPQFQDIAQPQSIYALNNNGFNQLVEEN